MVATFLISEKGKKRHHIVSHFGQLFWDHDTRAYEYQATKVLVLTLKCSFATLKEGPSHLFEGLR